MAELVGILNLTPDSFSDGGANATPDVAVRHYQQLFLDGATIVDIGAESTRPGAKSLEWQEEVDRLNNFIGNVVVGDLKLSLDTYHPETVRWAHQRLGPFIINDVTGFRDPKMREVAAETDLPIIVSHLPSSSSNIQDAHEKKPVTTINQVVEELELSIHSLYIAGVKKKHIIVDPGIGFGKTPELNWELLRFAEHMTQYPVMVGYSRKKFLGENRMALEPNIEAGRIAIASGATYLRVHDVAGHAQLLNA